MLKIRQYNVHIYRPYMYNYLCTFFRSTDLFSFKTTTRKICTSNISNTHTQLLFFDIHNIHLEFSTCPHKFKWLLFTGKRGLKIFDIKISIIFRFVSRKKKNVYLKAINFPPHNTNFYT